MLLPLFEDQEYNGLKAFSRGEYEHCTFTNCNLSQVKLNESRFVSCTFESCDLSNSSMADTALQEVRFIGCKMLGLQFNQCKTFGFKVDFDQCQLNHASFFKMKIPETKFRATNLEGVDFSECDLKHCTFDMCNLMDAVFDHTVLEDADFRSATDFVINPETNRVRKAKFSTLGLPGLLQKYELQID